MKKVTVPVVIYRNGKRHVVAEGVIEVPDDVNTTNKEVNITEAQLSFIQTGMEEAYSLPKDR